MPDSSPVARPSRLRRLALFGGGALLVLVLLLEVVARFGLPFGVLDPAFGAGRPALEITHAFLEEGTVSRQVSDPYLSYRLTGEGINSQGFVGPEWSAAKEPGTTRIACLGASTTEGNETSSYPAELGAYLSRQGHRVEVMNWGISGWTSAESLINFALRVQDFAPDIVIVHHAVNDVMPRVWPNFSSGYDHYRKPFEPPHRSALDRWLGPVSALWATWRLHELRRTTLGTFAVQPEPPPGSQPAALVETPPDAFVRNLRTLGRMARSLDARFLLTTMPLHPQTEDLPPLPVYPWRRGGLLEHNEAIRGLAKEMSWPLVDLENQFDARSEELGGFFIDLVHLQRPGHQVKARILGRALEKRGWLRP